VPYPARILAAAAETRLVYHDERIRFWTARRAELMAVIRSKGIEVNERIVLSHPSPKARASALHPQQALRANQDPCQGWPDGRSEHARPCLTPPRALPSAEM
jgi:hypothetical protein